MCCGRVDGVCHALSFVERNMCHLCATIACNVFNIMNYNKIEPDAVNDSLPTNISVRRSGVRHPLVCQWRAAMVAND